MGDEMDPCECIFNHEMTMRRLLSWLRQSQTTCTEGECSGDVSFPDEAGSGRDMTFMGLTMLWAAVALFLFYARPSRNTDIDGKPSGGGNDEPRNDPPAIS